MSIRTAKPASLIKTLKQHANKLSRTTDPDIVNDVVVWCQDYLEYSPTTDLKGWRTRFKYRARLDDLTTCVKHADGRRAICDLITLTISELEAMPDEEVRVYLLPGVREVSQEQLEHLAKARAASKAKTVAKKAAKAKRLAAVK